jgi:Mrp family chromosome partitioning ATPase
MTTNQAFIKAYRHDVAEPTTGSPAGGRATSLAHIGIQPARFTQLVTADIPGSTVAYVSPEMAYRSEPAHARTHQPAVAVQLDVLPYLPEAPEIADQPRGDHYRPTTRTAHAPSPIKRPLSSFTKCRKLDAGSTLTPPPSSPAALAFRPGTTIASFRWPAVCRRLAPQHGPCFDRVADLALAQANDSRPLIGVIGLFRGVGATTTLLCVAARLAARERRVILVDGHFNAPRLAAFLGAEPTAWWHEVLDHGSPLLDAVVRADDDNLDLLPLDPNSRSAPKPASRLQFSATAGALRHAYDVALVDLGAFFDPVSQPAALELVQNMRIETALAVTGPAPADARDLGILAERLGEHGCELLGTIENRVATEQHGERVVSR